MAGSKKRLAYKQSISALRTSSTLGIYSTFRPHFTFKHDTNLTFSSRLMADLANVMHARTMERIQQSRSSPLWWTIHTPIKVSSSALIRKHHTRRFRNAFKTALRDEGFDRVGKPSNASDLPPLLGSIKLMLSPDVVTADADKISKEVSSFVKLFVKRHPAMKKMKKAFG